MKTVSFTGKTVSEAKAEFLKLIGGEMPEGAEEMFENLKLTDDGVIVGMSVEVLDKDESPQGLSKGAKMELFNKRMNDGEDFDVVAKDIFGPVPAYNGVVGDSHDCDACNYRRQLDGVDILTDMKAGLLPDQAREEVKAGYAKTGRLVPNEALHPAGHASKEKNLEMVPGARARMIKLFGEDSQELKDFDAMVEAYKAGDANAEAMKKLDSLKAKVFSLI